jgi:indole-3-glycerol phosphate synthase
MKNILEEIYQHKLIEVRNCKKKLSLQEICKNLKCAEAKKIGFFDKLKSEDIIGKTALICEVKKASPSAGIIRENFNHLEIAKIYEKAKASCISVLTDEKYFLGSNQYLKEIRAISNLPILRKDFMVDAYQIYQSKLLGADCILLIVAMLSDQKLAELEQVAIDLDLDVLIEIHNEEELERAIKLKSKMIGINNRNLKTMKVDLQTSVNLASKVPADYLLIGESGIKNSSDILLLKQAKINCFLVGEHLMKQENIIKEIENLLS